jgi:glycogen debranching enzyme
MPDVLSVDERFAIVAAGQRSSGPLRVLKQGEAFGVFDQYGDIVPGEEQGLYFKGTRYLSGLELLLARHRPLLLSSTVSDDNAVFVADFTNLDVCHDGRIELPHGAIHLLRSRLLGDGFSLERIRLCNHAQRTVEIPIAIRFEADFADVFEVRGTARKERGTRLPTRLGDECVFGYLGLDGIERHTCIRWSRQPDALDGATARFLLRLEPHAPATVEMRVVCEDGRSSAGVPAEYNTALALARTTFAGRTERGCRVHTTHESLNRWLKRSTADLQMMLTETPHGLYPYAGIPWYSTPFGRDGLITALELLWAAPEVARGVLIFLAATQATTHSDVQDAEPGKILHEMRSGEMAALGEVPFGCYYGSIDSTPLFIMLACAYHARTADRALVDRLWPNLTAALEWMARDGDPDGDGFLEYARHSENGLVQQGWRDSSDSVFHADGTLAVGPIALCEVQGYAYAAWRGAAALADVCGDRDAARDWRNRAERLRERFDEAFWCDDLGTYAMALDGQKRPCRVKSSAAAHCLLTGIVRSGARADRVVATLMDDTSFAGWGIRTVAAGQARYNPMSYHNGSIWPHDNALAAAGLARAGYTRPAMRLFEAMLELSQSVDLHRLPELICGFHRRSEERPTLYPVACAPQAWAAGAVYLLIKASLGLEIDALQQRITFSRAMIPESVERMYLYNLTVGDAEVDLLLERHAHDVGVSVLRRQGEVDIVGIK